MAKVKSRYFNCEFEVTANKNGGDDAMNILSHEALRDIISNQIPVEKGVCYTYENFGNNHHPVVCCTMYDKSGRKVEAIGEATQSSLENEVAKMYPTVIAAQRAFDRAAIEFLAILGEGIYVDDCVSCAGQPAIEKTENQIESDDDFVIDECPVDFEDDFEVMDVPDSCTPDVVEERENDVSPSVVPKTTVSKGEDIGEIVINIGKYKNRPAKLSVVYETDKKWLEYVTANTIVTDMNRKQIEAGKKYLASRK